MLIERRSINPPQNSKILSFFELDTWNQWHDLGASYANRDSSPTREQERLMEEYPELFWCFDLGYRATLYRDS